MWSPALFSHYSLTTLSLRLYLLKMIILIMSISTDLPMDMMHLAQSANFLDDKVKILWSRETSIAVVLDHHYTNDDLMKLHSDEFDTISSKGSIHNISNKEDEIFFYLCEHRTYTPIEIPNNLYKSNPQCLFCE
jgi:hypothetical protein